MNITSVGSNAAIASTPVSGNNVIKLLEKQKEQLQEQIQKTSESKMDDKMKQEKIKELQAEIQQIDAEIQQRRSEQVNKSKNMEQPSSKTSASNNYDNGIENPLPGVNGLIQASASVSNAQIINNSKNNMQMGKQIIKTEFKLDGFTTPYKEKNLQNIDSKIRSLDEKFADAVQTTQKQIKKAKRDENKDNEEENKIESVRNTSKQNNQKMEDIERSDDREENAKPQGLKGIQVNYKRVDIKI